MSLWDKYSLNKLPDEQHVEILKKFAEEKTKTEQAKINSTGYQTVRGFIIVALLLAVAVMALLASSMVDSWKEVKIKSITPIVCPVPPPCPAPLLPKFDILITPIQTEKNPEVPDAGKQE